MCVISKQWWHTEAILILAQHRTIPGTARATITACLLTKQEHGAEDSTKRALKMYAALIL